MKLGKIIIGTLLLAIIFYFGMPTLSFKNPGMYLAATILFAMFVPWVNKNDDKWSGNSLMISNRAALLAIPFLILGVSAFFSTCGCFHLQEYKNQIGTVEKKEFNAALPIVRPDQMLSVNEPLARQVAIQDLAQLPELGKRAELGDMTLQNYHGQLVWVAPIVHSSEWRAFWNGNTPLPGYVIVSATNKADHRLVTEVHGKKIALQYVPSGVFGKDLARHLYFNGYMSSFCSDFTFEIDEDGYPYYTITKYKKSIGFAGEEAIALIIVDPQTGVIDEKKLDEVPDWVDRVHPLDFIDDQLDNWADYQNDRYFNWGGANQYKVVGKTMGQDPNGDFIYLYGITTGTGDKNITGFISVHSDTKQVSEIILKGISPDNAKETAVNLVTQFKDQYTADDPLVYNIDGVPTYEFVLHTQDNNNVKFAFVSVADGITGFGDTRQESYNKYKHNLLNSKGTVISSSTNTMEEAVVTDEVSRFTLLATSNGAEFYMILKSHPNELFVGASSLNNEVYNTQPGDIVTVKYFKQNTGYRIDITSFDNLGLMLYKEYPQVNQEVKADSVTSERNTQQREKVVDAKWEELTPKQKSDLLKNQKKE